MIRSSILVSFFSLLVALISLLNQLVLAKLFGASISMDAYLIAISVPVFLSGVLGATLSYSLVPALMVHKADYAVYRRFSGLLLISLILASSVIAAIGYSISTFQITLLGSTLSMQAMGDAILMARISWVTLVLSVFVGYLNAMHNASKSFLLPVAGSALPVVGMIFLTTVFGASMGPVAVVWGMFIGLLLTILLLLFTTRHALDVSCRCLLMSKEVAQYFLRAPMMVLGMLCFTVYPAIDAYWAPLIGSGNLAYLGYGQRILVAIGTLVIAGPSAVLMPRLAEAHVEGRVTDLLMDTRRAVRAVIAFATPVALSVSILATPLVRLVFERGTFDYQATQGVAMILPLMMLGMIAMLCVVVIFRALYASHDVMGASIIGILATVLYFVLSGLLSEKLGIKGIALAYAISWWLLLALSALRLWWSHIKILICKENVVFVGQIAALTAATGLVIYVGKIWMDDAGMGTMMLLLQLAMIGILSCVVYLVLAMRVFRIEEVRLIYAFVCLQFSSSALRLEKKGI